MPRDPAISGTGDRNAIGTLLATVNRLASTPALDRLRLRRPTERLLYQATRTGFRTVGAASRTFAAVKTQAAPSRPAAAPARPLFDLTPTEDQRMLQEAVRDFAAERVRPAAREADDACATPEKVLRTATELGIPLLSVTEELGGAADERSTISNVLVAEALAHGDMGIALACLAPAAVGTALSLWGDADQQATYLPTFTGEDVPAAALALVEPRALFDPLAPLTRARRDGADLVLDGVKSLVPLAATAELLVVGVDLDGQGPALVVVESGTAGVTIESEPSMGLRAAGLGRLVLTAVRVPATAVLAGPDGPAAAYRDCVRLSRLGWSALAVGTSQAVLDYVVPYVNEREAFGEPISNRQSVAFAVADIATELAGMRLVTHRAAARAEQGLPYAREVALARRLCTERGMTIGSQGVQLLGGHGYVKEHPVERWYRDLRAVAVMEGAVLV